MSVQGIARPIDSECSEGEDGTTTYTVRHEVITDVGDGPKIALSAPGLPKRGDTYAFGSDSDPFASCRGRTCSFRDANTTRKLFVVTSNYSTKGSSQDPGQSGNDTDPINWAWRCRLDTWTRMEAPDFDRNGRPFLNTVDEPFLPPPEKENPDPLIILEKNHPVIDLGVWAEAQGKVNSGVLWGLAARSVKLRKWVADPHWTGNGVMYWSLRMELEIKFAGWYFQPLNAGHREFVGIDVTTGAPKFREFRDEFWHPQARPQMLDMLGQKLPDGQPPTYFDQVGGLLQRFELEDEYDLSTILPATLPGNFTLPTP